MLCIQYVLHWQVIPQIYSIKVYGFLLLTWSDLISFLKAVIFSNILNYFISKFSFVELLNRLWMRYGTVWAICLSGKLETSGLWEPVNSHQWWLIIIFIINFYTLQIPSKVPISTESYAKWSLDAQTSNFWTWWWSIELKEG